MKKAMFSLLTIALTAVAGNSYARNVDVEMAKQAGANYLTMHTDLGTVTADDLTLLFTIDNEKLNIPATYTFNAMQGGWIIVSGNTLTEPIVGHSACEMLEIDRIPTPMMLLIEDYSRYVSEVQMLNQYEDVADRKEWEVLLTTEAVAPYQTKGEEEVILMKEKWDQNGDSERLSNGTTYDIYTPVINGKHAPVGCVATALSQICHFYACPEQPKGSVTYSIQSGGGYAAGTYSIKYDTIQFNYDLMPMHITGSTPIQNRKEVSKLCYAVGIGVRMGYGAEASGAQSSKVPAAMRTYFKYRRGSINYRRSSVSQEYLNYSPWNSAVNDSTFMSTLRADLMDGHPVYMGGVSSSGDGRDAGGHAWICDGYNTLNDNRYHMNWGWGGTGNAYFLLRDNSASGMYISNVGYCFNEMQECITGMYPDEALAIDQSANDARILPAYPNPATYSVVLPYSSDNEVTLSIYSIDGRMVEQRTLPAGGMSTEVRVDAMPSGIYTYRIGNATGKFVVK